MSDPDETRNPWQTLKSEVVYENPWIVVREDAVVRPDGQPGIYGVVSPRGVATAVVALTEANEVHLVGQYRYTTESYSWELVEGGSAPGETPLAAAQRELREETGLEAERWTPLGGEVHLTNSISDERGYIFVAQQLRRVSSPQPDGTELLRQRVLPFAEVLRRVDDGVLQDSMTIIGVLRCARWLATRGDPAPGEGGISTEG